MAKFAQNVTHPLTVQVMKKVHVGKRSLLLLALKKHFVNMLKVVGLA
jgi:hypothetical protein